ncbi:nad-dependent protein deacetylase sirtuin-7 [Anaeramoeba flamelloides]|uniref:protein acetyllysine N-acetyltransferase n=1 Tax=Anaeramoeba flamelloides TaxID=1746091 RepID=A0AAV7Y4R2_9EUKA|nr:nad-dependent protein deacetylase sirtuin-7 [Anaeramoeba flamelloides]
MDKEEIKEYFEENEELQEKVTELADMIRKANYVVFYTGAGISTSAGIPDFRGPNGVWTCRDQGRKAPRSKKPWNLLEPTYCHMGIAKLIELGVAKYLVSQNVDGLHVHSGVPLDKVSELHGNTNKEFCIDCKKEYFRPFRCRTARHVHDHRTGRMCEECGGELHDSIINFNESLNEDQLNRAYEHSEKCDLAIVLGTSLRVTPAASLPVIPVKQKTGKLVICNLQKTPKDKYASMILHGKTDQIFKLLMKELEIEVKSFKEVIMEKAQQIENKKKEKKTNQKKKVTKKKVTKKVNEKENIEKKKPKKSSKSKSKKKPKKK